MIDQLKSIAIFAKVVEEGSFRGAAKKLTVSPAIVSIHIKKLEEQIGVPLLYRSTRRVTLTEDGKALYESAKTIVRVAQNGLDQFAKQAGTHLTDLRVAMPDTLTTHPIIKKIAAFTKNHTGIRLNLISTDQQQNLVGEGHDVAIRMGYFKDSDLKSKKIAQDQRIIVAAPSFLNKSPKPGDPRDLMDLDFISFSLVKDILRLKKGNDTSVNVWGNVVAKASSTASVLGLCTSGLGIAALPYYLVQRELSAGQLVHVLPDWEDTKILPIFLVWISNAELSTATREFINFMSLK